MLRLLSTTLLISLAGLAGPAAGQNSTSTASPSAPSDAPRPRRPTPPTRDPHTPGYVTAKELPDGEVPHPDADGNFIIGSTHNPAPEMTAPEGSIQGARRQLHDGIEGQQDVSSGIARESGTRRNSRSE